MVAEKEAARKEKRIVCSHHSHFYDESDNIEVIDDGGLCVDCQRNAERKAEEASGH